MVLPVLGFLLLVVPLVELALIVAVADSIGGLKTFALLVLISIGGAVLLKREGLATWRRVQNALREGRIPAEEVTDGALVIFGGALLLTPGFFTDGVGLLLLLPGSRAVAKRAIRRLFAFLALKRLGPLGAAASAGRKVYSARVTSERRRTATPQVPEPAPSELQPPSGEDDSPDRG